MPDNGSRATSGTSARSSTGGERKSYQNEPVTILILNTGVMYPLYRTFQSM
jgi:hypothetical protein